jgi:hypothetical protein
MSAWSDYKMASYYDDDGPDGPEAAEYMAETESLDELASARDQDDADGIIVGIEPMGICSCCGGRGEVVVDIHYVPSTWTDPGFEQEEMGRCDDCGGSGFVALDKSDPDDIDLSDDICDPGYVVALDQHFTQERA